MPRSGGGALDRLGGDGPRHDAPFLTGLYGASEMFVDSFLDLAEAGVLKRAVDGAVLHAGFFLGPQGFYERLRAMSEAERARFQMTPIGFVNTLFGDEAGKRQARVHARFVNGAMMATLLGAVISDGLEDGKVASGVGGQHDFVDQAFALVSGRSIIALNATRAQRGKVVSNIHWDYPHATIPRHLRDMVVTEYGVADLRGRSDAEAVAAMLQIADARFQDRLLVQAQRHGKIGRGWRLPVAARANTPDRLAEALAPARAAGLLPDFPLGTDFTATEQRLLPALQMLKQAAGSPWRLAGLLLQGWRAGPLPGEEQACLERMGLARAVGLREQVHGTLLRAALAATRSAQG
jgi:hypothetical protein